MDEHELTSRLPLARPEELAEDLVRARAHDPRVGVGDTIVGRLDTSGAPGWGAAEFSRRFLRRTLRMSELELTVSPYAPPQRQLSAARQGAPMWPPAATPRSAPGAQPPGPAAPGTPPKVAARDTNELPADLKALLDLHRSRGTI